MGPALWILAWTGLVVGCASAAVRIAAEMQRGRLLAALRKRTDPQNIGPSVIARIRFGDARAGSLFLVVVLRDGLYLHGLFASHEFVIPGPSITYVGTPERGWGPRPGGPVAVRFLNTDGKEAGFSFRALSPASWVSAVKTRLLDR